MKKKKKKKTQMVMPEKSRKTEAQILQRVNHEKKPEKQDESKCVGISKRSFLLPVTNSNLLQESNH